MLIISIYIDIDNRAWKSSYLPTMKYIILLFASLVSAASISQRLGNQQILKVQNPVEFLEPADLNAYTPDCVKTADAGAAIVLNA
ncbi:hypothetical protein K7432_012775 [Basidiobolus ranarum]|uniref:Uncharacterized protein n=1 Tax=Basidiobolus ranarum TaxID=34480 RepID=A0ABR2WKG0_9FUNG